MKDEILGTASPMQLIKKLCLPTVVITLVMAIYNMTDIFFVGKTGNVEMVSALSVCMPIFMIIQAFGTLIGGGGGVASSIALGEDNIDKVKKITSFCCYGALIIGLIIAIGGNIFADQLVTMLGAADEYRDFAEEYLRIICAGAIIMVFTYSFVNLMRADGSAKESMLVNLAGTFTNMILDPIFILGLNMGPAGAAIATVLGNAVTLLLIFKHVKKKDTISLSIKDLSFERSISIKTIGLGMPLAVGTLLISVAYTVMNHILVQTDVNATGAFGVCRNIMLFSTMIQMGICMGIQPAISYNYGRGYGNRVKEISKKTGMVAIVFGIFIAVISIVFRDQILAAFLKDTQTLELARHLLIGCMITAPFYGIYQMCSVYLQATDQALKSTILTVLRQGVILIPVMYILNWIGGFSFLVFSFAVTDIIASATGLILVSRSNRLRKKLNQ